MTTPADALRVMMIVAACHHHTAPRIDDREVALATATIWAELFDEYNFSTDELIAAVKKRAKTCPEAPEPADVIRVARATRSDDMARNVLPAAEPNRADEHYPGDSKAAPDAAEYPDEWDSGQCRQAYWYALRTHAMPRTTAGWEAIGKQLKHEQAEHTEFVAPVTKPKGFADKIAAARQSLDAEQAKS